LQCSEAHEKQELCILLLNRRAVDYPVYVYAYQKPEGLIETPQHVSMQRVLGRLTVKWCAFLPLTVRQR